MIPSLKRAIPERLRGELLMIKRYTNRLAASTRISQSDRTISVGINAHDLFLGQATVLNGVGDYHGPKNRRH